MLSFPHHPAAIAFGLTLLHALWQAALVAGLVALLHTRIADSRTRYATALGGLLLLPGLAVATFYYCYAPVPVGTPVDAGQWLALPAATGPQGVADATSLTDWRAGLAYLTAAYLLGLCLFALRLAASGLRLYFLRRRGLRPVDPAWRERMHELNRRYAIRPAARLFGSERVDQVLSFGHFKPLILFPIGLLNQLTPAEVEAILLHELAHLQRRDYLWNWLQSAVETAYFFHPAVYWLGGRIRHERECCCDDWVAQRTDKTIYAQSLIHLARFAQTPTNQLAMYANSTPSSLGRRIERLFQPTARRRSVLPVLLLLIPFVLLAWRPLQTPPAIEPPSELVVLDTLPAEAKAEPAPLRGINAVMQPPASSPLQEVAPAPTVQRVIIDGEVAPADILVVRTRSAESAPESGPADVQIIRPRKAKPASVADTVRPEPLYIIDGVALPLGDKPTELDPSFIESVTVWKGEKATQRYGERGANGVIVIATKTNAQPNAPAPEAPIDHESNESEQKIRIRATERRQPLYVLDGEIQPENYDLDRIDPNDIKSINVLKGKSAGEAYGSEFEEGGVIEIFTKGAGKKRQGKASRIKTAPAPAPQPERALGIREVPAPAPQPERAPGIREVPAPAPQPQIGSLIYPNPSTGETQFRFRLDTDDAVTLTIFDAGGRQVRSRSFGQLPKGEQQLNFDVRDLAPGTYTVIVQASTVRWKASLVRP